MNFKSLPLLCAVAFVAPVKADAPAPEKVAYIAKVPSEIRRGAVGRKYTRFFGKTVIAGQSLALHFYDTQRPKTDENGATSQKSRLDVYLETRSHNRSVYKRINSVPITYDRPDGGNPDEKKFTIQVEKLWLNPKTQTQPTLHFNLNIFFSAKPQTKRELPYEYEIGLDALFIFSNGMTREAVVQQFATSGDPASYDSNNFSTLDKEGFTTVYRKKMFQAMQDFEGWKWNGTQFLQVDRAFHDRGEIGECKWDGEKITKTVYEP